MESHETPYHFPAPHTESCWNKFAEAHEFVYSQRDGLVSKLEKARAKRMLAQLFDEDEGEDEIT